MSWNYRVTRTQWPGSVDGALYEIREVYYADDGRPTSWTAQAIGARGESAQECRDDHGLMAEAFTKPVLDITDAAHPFEVTEPTTEPTEEDRREAQVARRAGEYLVAGLNRGLPEHEHLLAARVEVDPNDDFECPLCAFVDGLLDDLTLDGLPASVVAFAQQTPDLVADAGWARLADLTRGWLEAGLDRFPDGSLRVGPGLEGAPRVDPADLGVTMRRLVRAAADKTGTPAEALARVWSGWTVHRLVTGTRRNTTAVISRDGYVGLVRMYSWDYWAYTVRGVPASHWHRKTVEERLTVLIDCVRTARLATSVSDLLDLVASAGMVTTKGVGYAQRAKALAVREVQAAFPTGQMP